MVKSLNPDETAALLLYLKASTEAVCDEMEPGLKPNVENLAANWRAVLASGVGRAYGLYVRGIPRGYFLGLIYPYDLTGNLIGQECHWGVEKEYRFHALKLLKEFEKDCVAAKCQEIICTATHGPLLPRMRKLYAHLGYKPKAEAFIKQL